MASTFEKKEGYNLATSPLYFGKTSPFDEKILISPTPTGEEVNVFTVGTTYTFNVVVTPKSSSSSVVESSSGVAPIPAYKWVVAYGDPFISSSDFKENNIISYGETSSFSFKPKDLRNIFVRIDIYDALDVDSMSFSSLTRTSRIYKYKTTTNGSFEKIFYSVLLGFVLVCILAVFIFVWILYLKEPKIYGAQPPINFNDF